MLRTRKNWCPKKPDSGQHEWVWTGLGRLVRCKHCGRQKELRPVHAKWGRLDAIIARHCPKSMNGLHQYETTQEVDQSVKICLHCGYKMQNENQ